MPEDWTPDITALATFFSSVQLPQSIQVSSFERITDAKKFVEGHMEMVKANNGKGRFRVYLERLQELKTLLEQNKIEQI